MAFSPSSGDSNGPVSEINITPLVDVMLVLLVIFMVTTPMMENGIPLQLPKASSKAIPKGDKPVTLSITKETRVFINKEEVPYSQLKLRLKDYFKNAAKKKFSSAPMESWPTQWWPKPWLPSKPLELIALGW